MNPRHICDVASRIKCCTPSARLSDVVRPSRASDYLEIGKQ